MTEDQLDDFEDKLAELEGAFGGAQNLASVFSQELRGVQATIRDTNREIATMKSGISSGLRKAIDGLVFDGARLSDALQQIGKSMLDAAYSAAIKPVTNHVGGLLATGLEGLISGVSPFAKGGSFVQGRVMPFANGGIVSGPTTFPMRGGMGLMGEAGPEAIMPLARGADGRLGVRTSGGSSPVNVVMNISTPDVQGFQRTQSQTAAMISRAIARGQRNR